MAALIRLDKSLAVRDKVSSAWRALRQCSRGFGQSQSYGMEVCESLHAFDYDLHNEHASEKMYLMRESWRVRSDRSHKQDATDQPPAVRRVHSVHRGGGPKNQYFSARFTLSRNK